MHASMPEYYQQPHHQQPEQQQDPAYRTRDLLDCTERARSVTSATTASSRRNSGTTTRPDAGLGGRTTKETSETMTRRCESSSRSYRGWKAFG